MSEFSSVLELAQAVAGEANRIKSGKAAELNADRVLSRVNETQRSPAETGAGDRGQRGGWRRPAARRPST